MNKTSTELTFGGFDVTSIEIPVQISFYTH